MAYGYKQCPRDNLIIPDVPRTLTSFAMEWVLGNFLSRSMGVRVGTIPDSSLIPRHCAINIVKPL